jgi:triacylglycerol esterase/lipase EstA (alpha/beta hydrolase family)
VAFQDLFNTAMGALMLLAGWFLRVVWDSVKQLQAEDRELADKVSRIEVLVAGEYVKKDDFDRLMMRMFDKLDAIERKIDSKADK